jgi:ribosomal protein L20A (L18A)
MKKMANKIKTTTETALIEPTISAIGALHPLNPHSISIRSLNSLNPSLFSKAI